jgi:hypothetical protein
MEYHRSCHHQSLAVLEEIIECDTACAHVSVLQLRAQIRGTVYFEEDHVVRNWYLWEWKALWIDVRSGDSCRLVFSIPISTCRNRD